MQLVNTSGWAPPRQVVRRAHEKPSGEGNAQCPVNYDLCEDASRGLGEKTLLSNILCLLGQENAYTAKRQEKDRMQCMPRARLNVEEPGRRASHPQCYLVWVTGNEVAARSNKGKSDLIVPRVCVTRQVSVNVTLLLKLHSLLQDTLQVVPPQHYAEEAWLKHVIKACLNVNTKQFARVNARNELNRTCLHTRVPEVLRNYKRSTPIPGRDSRVFWMGNPSGPIPSTFQNRYTFCN